MSSRSPVQPAARGPPLRRPPSFAAAANAQADLYDEAGADRLGVLGGAGRALQWDQPWDEVLRLATRRSRSGSSAASSTSPSTASTGTSTAGNGDQVALHWEGEPGDTRTLTYAELKDEVCQAANALTELGVTKGDRVAIYMPMIPETAIAMLACARIGAPHSVVFGGFSADALQGRIQDADASVVITADGGYRRGAPSALKPAVDEALAAECPDVEQVLVVRRTGQDVAWTDGPRRVVARRSSSGRATSTRRRRTTPSTRCSSSTPPAPRRSRRASCTPPAATSPRSSYTHRNVFDLKPETDVFWCTADIGWVTGHSYIVYGPLANGATQVMYEGTPDTPHKGRWWEIWCRSTASRSSTPRPRDPHVHEVGRGHPRRGRPVVAAAARLGRRADQPGGVDVVPREHRRRPTARSSTPGGRPRPAPS